MTDSNPREETRQESLSSTTTLSTAAIRGYLFEGASYALPRDEVRAWCREAHRLSLTPERAVVEFKALLQRLSQPQGGTTDPLLRLRRERLVALCIALFYDQPR